ncbi:MAG: alpha/beta hydrolase [Hyphomonas sp.]|nr:alpha/beta hydrolase [Hyphomonas sp.]MCB9962004.1 alpha/beta hydrolase [Hyphomonas sp.]MCB9970996.1 alpha/beta hydrolase [Hyphomonas sp.]
MPSAAHEQIVVMMSGGLGLDDLSVEEQRAVMEASADMFPVEPDIVSREVDAGGVPADWVTVDGSDADRVVLYLHGGGYVMGSRNTHRGLAGRIARAAKARVLLPEYRLAPEHPFPAAVDDATACWRWLVSQGFAPQRMAIAGDSAGGGLTLATLLALKANVAPMPACAVALSPWTDLEGSGPTAEPGAVDDPMLTPDGLRVTGQQYAAGALRHPLAAPLHGALAGLPPLLLQVGTREVLLSDSTRFAEKARAAGVDVTLEIEEGLIHVWQMFPDVPEAQSAVQRIGAFVRANC